MKVRKLKIKLAAFELKFGSVKAGRVKVIMGVEGLVDRTHDLNSL